jgi:hypothetical protein
MFGVWFCNIRTVIEEHIATRGEESASVPAIPFGPKRQRCQKRWLTYCSPSVGIFPIRDGLLVKFTCEVNQQRSVRREVGTPDINVTVERLPLFEDVSLSIPFDDLDPLTRPASENHSNWRPTRQKHLQSTWRVGLRFHSDCLWSASSSSNAGTQSRRHPARCTLCLRV